APTSELYIIPKGGFATAAVNGMINMTQYIQGVPVEITFIDPNELEQKRKIRVNSDGAFNFETVLDENILNGTYTLIAEYRDKKSKEVAVEIRYEKEEKNTEIPQWVKNSVRWWAEDKLNELDFILGIQDLIRKGILNPPTPENLTLEELEENQSFGVKIPKYVKQTSLWWTEGMISDQEYVDGIQYLIKKGYLVI
ncbi:MAG: hypothetical protein ACO2Y5_07830, partial [Nitrosopumilaceae archaeon]